MKNLEKSEENMNQWEESWKNRGKNLELFLGEGLWKIKLGRTMVYSEYIGQNQVFYSFFMDGVQESFRIQTFLNKQDPA